MENISQVITEKNYPITKLWIFKAPIIIILLNVVALFFGYYFPYLVLAIPIMLIVNPLIRANFHYSLDDKFFDIKQGVISKKRRSLPYGVIQNVFVKQDLFDRIFGLATLRVENASQAGGGSGERWWNKSYGSKATAYGQNEGVGSSGNKVNIPGLKKQNAEDLKSYILQKIKENPIEDSQSGL
ncbi:MAG: PH domain-containing protein [bacterium]|nr:PH domain-containing protein [bacterium]